MAELRKCDSEEKEDLIRCLLRRIIAIKFPDSSKSLMKLIKLLKEDQHRDSFAKNGGVNHLVTSLKMTITSRTNDDGIKQSQSYSAEAKNLEDFAALILQCLLTSTSKNMLCIENFFELGGLKVLEAVLLHAPKESIVKTTCSLILVLSTDSESFIISDNSGIISTLVNILPSYEEKQCSIAILRCLWSVCHDDKSIVHAVTAIGFPFIVKMLASNEVRHSKSALKIIYKFLKVNIDFVTHTILRNDGLGLLLSLHRKNLGEDEFNMLSDCLYFMVMNPQVRVSVGATNFIESCAAELAQGALSRRFRNALLSLCLCAMEAMNRMRIRMSGALARLVTLLGDSNYSTFHGQIVSTFVCFLFDDLSLDVMLRSGLLQNLLIHFEKLLQLRTHSRLDEVVTDFLSNMESNSGASSPGQISADGVISNVHGDRGPFQDVMIILAKLSQTKAVRFMVRSSCINPLLEYMSKSPKFDSKADKILVRIIRNPHFFELLLKLGVPQSIYFQLIIGYGIQDIEKEVEKSILNCREQTEPGSLLDTTSVSLKNIFQQVNTEKHVTTDGGCILKIADNDQHESKHKADEEYHESKHGANNEQHKSKHEASNEKRESKHEANKEQHESKQEANQEQCECKPEASNEQNKSGHEANNEQHESKPEANNEQFESKHQSLGGVTENEVENEGCVPKSSQPEFQDTSLINLPKLLYEEVRYKLADKDTNAKSSFELKRPVPGISLSGNSLIIYLAQNANSPFGKGVLTHGLLSDSKETKERFVMGCCVLCRSTKLQKKIFIELGGLTLLSNMVHQFKDNEKKLLRVLLAFYGLARSTKLSIDEEGPKQVYSRTPSPQQRSISDEWAPPYKKQRQDSCFDTSSFDEKSFVSDSCVDVKSTSSSPCADERSPEPDLYFDRRPTSQCCTLSMLCCNRSSKEQASKKVPNCESEVSVSAVDEKICFKVEDCVKVTALKNAIVSGSPVFSAMFSSSFVDSSLSCINIKDVYASSFLVLLHHIHGCNVALDALECVGGCHFSGDVSTDNLTLGDNAGMQEETEDSDRNVLSKDDLKIKASNAKCRERVGPHHLRDKVSTGDLVTVVECTGLIGGNESNDDARKCVKNIKTQRGGIKSKDKCENDQSLQSCRCKNLQERHKMCLAVETMRVSDRFMSDELMLKCESFLAGSIAEENVADLYIAAASCQAKILTERCLRYILVCLENPVSYLNAVRRIIMSAEQDQFISDLENIVRTQIELNISNDPC